MRRAGKAPARYVVCPPRKRGGQNCAAGREIRPLFCAVFGLNTAVWHLKSARGMSIIAPLPKRAVFLCFERVKEMVLQFAHRCFALAKREAVLTAALVLAVVSAFFVPPSAAYIGYIDWDTLALLFSLMAVMKGYQQAGFFIWLANGLLKHVRSSRALLAVLVFMPFALSMVVTNDVSLITFVPFGLVVLRMSGQERQVVPLVVLQTLAANLGSMLTPMGNPQNLYLYAKSGMSFGSLCLLMLPYVALSGVCIALLIVFRRPMPVRGSSVPVKLAGPRRLGVCTLGFALCLLGLFDVVSPIIICAATAIFLLFTDRPLLASIDYSLLGIFAAFFIFIGNISDIDLFRDFISRALAGHVELVAVLASQVTSNVPAALLLSGFTDQWGALIVGCNLGGLGTLIASMASLISYKAVSREYPERKGRYFALFTVSNIALLAILLALSAALNA